MTDAEFARILSLGRENSGVEFKGPGRRGDRRLFAQVVRAVLGMSNLSGGGNVIVGVADRGRFFDPVGLSAGEMDTWQYDDIADGLATYADPSVDFEIEVREFEGKSFLVIIVEEFRNIPVLCKRDYPNVLRAGACYVRSRRKPETSEIPTQEDMRNLVELAAEKRFRSYVEFLRRVGLVDLPDVEQSSPNDADG